MAAAPTWFNANPDRYRSDPIFQRSANDLLAFARGGFSQPSGRGGGGGNPYGGILSEFLNASKARFGAQSAADAASRDAAIQRAIISYGQVPDFEKLGIGEQTLGYLKGAMSDKVKQLAEQNTKEGTSVYARQAHANDVANRKIPATLAARGLLRSGQTGYDLGEQAQNYKIQGFDTLNELLGGIEGTVSNFLNAERARQEALAQAELQAQMAAYSAYGGDMYSDPAQANFRKPYWQQAGVGPRPGPYDLGTSSAKIAGYFGNPVQTRTALNNRLRAGRM